jgi:hypothetical protein
LLRRVWGGGVAHPGTTYRSRPVLFS